MDSIFVDARPVVTGQILDLSRDGLIIFAVPFSSVVQKRLDVEVGEIMSIMNFADAGFLFQPNESKSWS